MKVKKIEMDVDNSQNYCLKRYQMICQIQAFLKEGCSYREIARRMGVGRNTIAKYETEANTPSAAVFSLICREFNVNEDWLRDGIGEMFLPTDRNTDIAKLTKQLLNEEDDSFKNRFISMLANLSVEEWEFLERKAKELYQMDNKEDRS